MALQAERNKPEELIGPSPSISNLPRKLNQWIHFVKFPQFDLQVASLIKLLSHSFGHMFQRKWHQKPVNWTTLLRLALSGVISIIVYWFDHLKLNLKASSEEIEAEITDFLFFFWSNKSLKLIESSILTSSPTRWFFRFHSSFELNWKHFPIQLSKPFQIRNNNIVTAIID